jgi:hypothetical protein
MSRIRISRTILLTTLAASLMLLFSATASARVIVGFGVGFPVYGGYWGGPYGYPYGPYGYPPYGPYGYPGAYGPYGYGGRPIGEVHIKTPAPDAEIYINGSYAGRAHDLKHIYLAAGTYRIEQRIGADVQKQRIYVTAYRKLTIDFGKPGTPNPPDMQPPPPPPNGYRPGPGPNGYGPGPGPNGSGPGPGPNGPPPGNGPAPEPGY